jgi:hypothetical protein
MLTRPRLAKTLVLSSLTKSAETTELMKNMADYYMCFPIQEYGLLDFVKVKIKKISELGYAYACEKLSEWDKDSSLNLPKMIQNRREVDDDIFNDS